jgi:hypothetical protein
MTLPMIYPSFRSYRPKLPKAAAQKDAFRSAKAPKNKSIVPVFPEDENGDVLLMSNVTPEEFIEALKK